MHPDQPRQPINANYISNIAIPGHMACPGNDPVHLAIPHNMGGHIIAN
jgi:hypothetical protein